MGTSHTVLPASPNWYCSKVADGNHAGLFIYGARHDVYCFDCQIFPPKFKGAFLGHRDKVTALCLGKSDEGDVLCCSSSEDGVVVLWNVETREILNQHCLHSVSFPPMTKHGNHGKVILYMKRREFCNYLVIYTII